MDYDRFFAAQVDGLCDEGHQARAAEPQRRLAAANLPVMPSVSHIVPVPVRSDAGMERLVAALSEIWAEFDVKYAS